MEIRGAWKSNTGFLLAAIGSAVGLGNIWRFPYVAYENGGGAFLIPYFIALITAGIPILMLELALGQKKRASAPMAFSKIDSKWEWLGWWSVSFVMFGIVLYYIVVIGWCADYMFFSIFKSWGSDTNDFFFNKFLCKSGGVWEFGGLNYPIVFAVFVIWFCNWLITYKGIEKGIEKASKLMMPQLFLITVVIIVWAVSLDGAEEGISVYMKPDFAKLRNIKVWIDAYGQIFFSLSLGFGIMIAYASYLPRKTNILKNSLIIGFANSFYEVFAGFGVFSVLGYMALKQGKPIEEVVTSGIGLAFVAYPEAISLLPWGQLFGVLFFFLLVIAGISSSISIIEAFSSAILDKFGIPRRKVITTVCIIGFFGSLLFCTHAGLFWLDIVDHFLNHFGLVTVGILEAIVIGWLYKTHRLKNHIVDNLGLSGNRHRVFKYIILQLWMYCIKFITPVALGLALIYSLIEEFKTPYSGYPVSGIVVLGIGWLLITHLFAFGLSGLPWKKEIIREK
ncbi:MAG: sodium-dependent transporter [Desulfobacterium sp.]|nr:sodium-dependent transporter [Desulfobacterium sp.]MBU3947591.1 sodium-dependent transporter [Pseudomonadota bacterium]MBU4037840.1 sodium-dependent transporter [Pseudomonadota bacterium]